MGRFNPKKVEPTKTINLAGGEAYKESPELEFVSILLTSFAQDQFYRKAGDTFKNLSGLIDILPDKKFAAQAAIYARTVFGMRSITHVAAGELSAKVKGSEWMRPFIRTVVYRPDDMIEIMSYYMGKYGKRPLPNALRRGLADSFGKFDGYALGKYRAEGKDLSLIDVVNLVRPKAVARNAEALKALVEGTLISTETWESKLTEAGQKGETKEEKEELKKEAWATLLKEKKLGYFALLRNLRNIIQQAPEMVDIACQQLTDPATIKHPRNLVMPFRYLAALDEIKKISPAEGTRKVIIALEKAVDISCDNIPKLPGKTLIALDVSGSMTGGFYHTEDKKSPAEIGALFSALLYKSNDSDMLVFGDRAEYMKASPAQSTLELARSFKNRSQGTNFHSIFQVADKKYDRIIILSDMQGWMGYYTPAGDFNAYKKRTGASPKIYSFDLQNYGTLQFPEKDVYALAGFSEKIFDIMALLESDKNALVNEIKKIEI